MKIGKLNVYFFRLLLLVGVIHLKAANLTIGKVTIPESWQNISNRWVSVPLDKIQQTAEQGDVTAQFYLGWTYWNGIGTTTNKQEATKWFQSAADQGLAAGQNRIGWMYHHGEYLENNFDKALQWYHKASEQDYPNANYNLGSMYYSGEGVTQNYSEAANYYRRAADQGNAIAQSSLGYLYREGLGVSKDSSESVKWYRKAADLGVAEAQRSLGYAYETGTGLLQDYAEAVKLYRLAADQGDAQAQMNLGRMYEKGISVPQDYAEAAKLYRLAAEQGHALAQNNLGYLFYQGLGVTQDSAEAMKWYQKSANQGEALGEENLGWMYRYADPEKPNFELSRKWMKLAAEQGSADAEYQYALLLMMEFDNNGHSILANLPEQGEWFRKAANQGLAKAQYELAEMYHSGQLGEDQRSNCIPWFLKAAAQDYSDAQAEVGNLRMFYPDSELLKSVDKLGMLRKAAESGSLDAQFDLAKRYRKGIGVPKDSVEAFKWMKMAAENDHPSSIISDAICGLAEMYENGEGVATNLSESRNLFLLAADRTFKNPEATFRAGQIYEKGDGVPQNDKKAVELYENVFYYDDYPEEYPNGRIITLGPSKQSIESLYRLWALGKGMPTQKMKEMHNYYDPNGGIRIYWEPHVRTAVTEFYAGEIYYNGKLVNQDLVEADARFHLAASLGFTDADKMIKEIEPKMSPSQLEEATKRKVTLSKIVDDGKKQDEELKRLEEITDREKGNAFR